MTAVFLIENYQLEAGSALDRARLVKFMHKAYQEMGGSQTAHLASTVQRHFSSESHLWWLIDSRAALPAGLPGTTRREPVGCLWLGEGIDQRSGIRQAYVFLLYVAVEHRRQGLGKALMTYAQQWATQMGYAQIGLQVFEDNAAALSLYEQMGYEPQARWLSLEL
ncbi:MAG: N-acetyltransferase [Phormidesmis sp.]